MSLVTCSARHRRFLKRPGVARFGIVRVACALLLGCMLLAAELRAQTPPQAAGGAVRVNGVEVESSTLRNRVLVFADGPVRPQLEELDRGTVVLVFPGATLDPSAHTHAAAPSPQHSRTSPSCATRR